MQQQRSEHVELSRLGEPPSTAGAAAGVLKSGKQQARTQGRCVLILSCRGSCGLCLHKKHSRLVLIHLLSWSMLALIGSSDWELRSG